MFYVYVLYSKTFDKIYIGFTSDLNARLLSHNKLAKKGYTVRYRPWAILYTEQHQTKAEALVKTAQVCKGARNLFGSL
jgi:putative endonuclease